MNIANVIAFLSGIRSITEAICETVVFVAIVIFATVHLVRFLAENLHKAGSTKSR